MSKQHDEGEVGFTFDAGDGESWYATPENASLFLFIGDLAIHDHVFIVSEEERDEDEIRTFGTYIFLITQDPETVEEIKDFMMNNGYQTHMNLREVAECDRDAYQGLIDQRVAEAHDEIGDFVPEGWQ